MEEFELGDLVRMKKGSEYYRECRGEDGTVIRINRENDPEHGYTIMWTYGGISSLGTNHIYGVCDRRIIKECISVVRNIILHNSGKGE